MCLQTNKRYNVYLAGVTNLRLKIAPARGACQLLMLMVVYDDRIYTTSEKQV